MAKKVTFSKEDEEFFGKNGSFGVPKFDLEMNGGFLVVSLLLHSRIRVQVLNYLLSNLLLLPKSQTIHSTSPQMKDNKKSLGFTKNTTGHLIST